MAMHKDQSPIAGQTVRIKGGTFAGASYRVEDWWDRVGGGSWMSATGNPACLTYAMRTALGEPVPLDDEVLYGKIEGMGHLFHVTELDTVTEDPS